jgi:spore photoproduct lyase
MRYGQRASKFIRQFSGPGDHNGIVCFKFWQLIPAGGCPYRCSYCFLQTVPRFRFHPEELPGLVYTNVEDMLQELEEWLLHPIPRMMIVGELQDGLVFDSAFEKVTGKPLTHWIIPAFARQGRHRLIFLTKSTEVKHAIALPPTQQVVFSWSVNAEEVGTRWEHGTPPPSERFLAAERMMKAGWPIRFRLDPMVPYPDWKRGYSEAVRKINALKPEMVTLGALRATSYHGLRNAAKANGRDDTIFNYLTEQRDPSGFKYRIPFDKQVEMFRFAIDRLKVDTVPALCKEDRGLWKALRLKFQGCHCLLGAKDEIVVERRAEMTTLRGRSTPAAKTLLPVMA